MKVLQKPDQIWLNIHHRSNNLPIANRIQWLFLNERTEDYIYVRQIEIYEKEERVERRIGRKEKGIDSERAQPGLW